MRTAGACQESLAVCANRPVASLRPRQPRRSERNVLDLRNSRQSFVGSPHFTLVLKYNKRPCLCHSHWDDLPLLIAAGVWVALTAVVAARGGDQLPPLVCSGGVRRLVECLAGDPSPLGRNRHCWLVPVFHGQMMAGAPSAVEPSLMSSRMPRSRRSGAVFGRGQVVNPHGADPLWVEGGMEAMEVVRAWCGAARVARHHGPSTQRATSCQSWLEPSVVGHWIT